MKYAVYVPEIISEVKLAFFFKFICNFLFCCLFLGEKSDDGSAGLPGLCQEACLATAPADSDVYVVHYEYNAQVTTGLTNPTSLRETG